jgi:serine/threonine protein kinase
MLMGNWDFHCPNCFSEKTDGKRQCPYCGYDEGESRSPAALPLRTILNNQYVVGRVLGSPGGFGITYLCWDIKLATCVAIKEFMPRDNAVRDRDQCSIVAHSGKDRDFFEYGLKAFLAEARTVAGFDHPNIVKVRYFFEQNHTAYLVMDFYKGVSLAEYVKQKGGRLPEKVALGITRFVLDGLRHVHDSGYLHRDVKPANIYLTGKGQVLLLDFGAARYAMGEHSRSLSVVVTPGFSPFEQYSTKGKQGPWTDIYASGATLYYMLTGNLPESAPDRVLSDTLAEPVQLLPDLPLGVNKGIMLALRVKASDRPQSIEELKKILSGSPQPDSVVNIKKKDGKSDRKEKREEKKKPAIPLSRRMKVIAIGACLLVLLAVVYGYWGRSGVLVVMSHPEDAEVWMNGVYQGRGPLRFEKMSPGKRVVSAKQSGYVPQEKTVEIVSGRETTVELDMSPTSPKTETDKGTSVGKNIKKAAETPPKETAQKSILEQPSDFSSEATSSSKGVKIIDGVSIAVGSIKKNGFGGTLLRWQAQNETDQIVEIDIDSYAIVDGRQYETRHSLYKIFPHAVSQEPLFFLPIDDPNKLFEASDVKFILLLEDSKRKIKGTATMQFKGHELKQYFRPR